MGQNKTEKDDLIMSEKISYDEVLKMGAEYEQKWKEMYQSKEYSDFLKQLDFSLPRPQEEAEKLSALRYYVESQSAVRYIVTPRLGFADGYDLSVVVGSGERKIMSDVDFVAALVGELVRRGGKEAVCDAIETYLVEGNDKFENWLSDDGLRGFFRQTDGY